MREPQGSGSSSKTSRFFDPVEQDPSAVPYTSPPEIAVQVARLFSQAACDGLTLQAELTNLAETLGDDVYSEFLHQVCHLRFRPREAHYHWQQILNTQTAMSKRLGSPVDVRVAMASYFVDIRRRLHHPKIVEMQVFEQARALSYRDALTGLFNFRYFEEHFPIEVERVDRYGKAVSLLFADLDGFKKFNDQYGHLTGNQALAQIGNALLRCLRTPDRAIRYGGEEFAVILPATTKEDALRVAERFRQRIEAQKLTDTLGRDTSGLTVSVGVATYPGDADTAEGLVAVADRALYQAKRDGKNRVFSHGQNRRSYPRMVAIINGSCHRAHIKTSGLVTGNLSEGGLMVVTDQRPEVGALIDIQLKLPIAKQVAGCSGRVVRVKDRPDGRFEAGVSIMELQGEDRLHLLKFLRAARRTRPSPCRTDMTSA